MKHSVPHPVFLIPSVAICASLMLSLGIGALAQGHEQRYCLIQDCHFNKTSAPPGAKYCGFHKGVWLVRRIDETYQSVLTGCRYSIFSPDGKMLAGVKDATKYGREIQLWDAQVWKLRGTMPCEKDDYPLAFSPDSKLLASCDYGGYRVVLWEVETGRLRRRLELTGYSWIQATSCAFSPDEKTLACGSAASRVVYRREQEERAKVWLWDVASGQLLTTLRGDEMNVRAVVFSPDGRTLASGGDSRTIHLWDVKTRRLLRTLNSERGTNSLTFSPDGKTLASVNGLVSLWDMETGTLRRTLGDYVNAIAFSPDGKTYLESLRHFSSRRDVKAVAFSPDGETVATASEDGSVYLWSVATGRLLLALKHGSSVESVILSLDGKVLSSSGNEVVNLWRIQ